MKKSVNSDEIYRILEEEIVNLQIKPGEALSENDLCLRFDVSRTPIRAVLQRLQENGLVNITPHRATTVTLMNFSIIDQLIYQRVAVESMVIRDFMHIASPLHIEKIKHLIKSSQELLQVNFESNEFFELDGKLHELWFHEIKKDYLWQSIQRPQANYSRFRMLDIVETRHYDEIVMEHLELLEIIENKADSRIEPLMRKHLYGGVKRLGEHIYTDLKGYFVQGN